MYPGTLPDHMAGLTQVEILLYGYVIVLLYKFT